MNQIDTLQEIINHAKRIIFFTGAGASTESGIPDFRSQNGLYAQKYDYPPEEIVSHTFLTQYPDIFYDFYKNKMVYPNAEPNLAHQFMAKAEEKGISTGVITQNIDGLHQKAGSKHVYELHGSTLRNYCVKCHHTYPVETILEAQGIPHCPKCGGMIRPDVVLYEESLDQNILEQAVRKIQTADVMIVCGTSLTVYPAAGLIRYFQGDSLVIINKSTTNYDQNADLCIQDSLSNVFSKIQL